jgi:uncharacterized protein with HEPN domain
MRGPIRDRERLEHIIAAIDRIIRYTSDKSYEDLVADDMMYYAVVKNIEIIGEAANMLTPQFQQTNSETPWKMVKGMRNYIVHEYFQIDDIVVWDVVKNNLPELRAQVSRYLAETNWDNWEKQLPTENSK